jgi:N-ethylmaleimide reductase
MMTYASTTTDSVLHPYQLGALTLPNRVVMAPMTRGRATNADLAPTELDAEYFAQRASAGLMITSGTWINEQSIGYPNVPGIYTETQTAAWAGVTEAVHRRGGRIFSQFGHLGALSHRDLQDGRQPVGPSAVNMGAKVFVNGAFVDSSDARALTLDEIRNTVRDYGRAARNAKAANFDGVEVHAQANHLLPQFLNDAINTRTDDYGGSITNRVRLLLEALEAIREWWGPGQVGIKLTPGATGLGALNATESTVATYDYLFERVNDFELSYLNIGHVPGLDLTGTALESLNGRVFEHVRERFNGTLIIGGGFGLDSANGAIDSGLTDLVAFGKLYIGNPDLVERFSQRLPLADSDPATYYQGGAQGYTDYPRAATAAA